MSTESTQNLTDIWIQAQRNLKRAERDASNAEVTLSSAEVQLGKRLVPSDMQIGEEIAIWVRISSENERLLVVKMLNNSGNGTYKLSFRGDKRPKEKMA